MRDKAIQLNERKWIRWRCAWRRKVSLQFLLSFMFTPTPENYYAKKNFRNTKLLLLVMITNVWTKPSKIIPEIKNASCNYGVCAMVEHNLCCLRKSFPALSGETRKFLHCSTGKSFRTITNRKSFFLWQIVVGRETPGIIMSCGRKTFNCN